MLNRLNDLYKIGMERFLDKKVTDFDISKYKGQDIYKELEALRLHKNNEFAFVEVFNEQTFEQNAVIVKEVIQLLEG